MTASPNLNGIFERAAIFPDVDARDRLSQLVGLDAHKSRLGKILAVLVNPDGLRTWAQTNHPSAHALVRNVIRRPPLVILAGDVGSGKTELAETIGDEVARQERISVTLLPLSLSARGQGRVGEMTQLISAAFEHAVAEAGKFKSTSGKARGGVILLVDEADALAQSREAAQMHHEDRAGVNAFIRGIDRLGNGALPAAVIMCTNRVGSLDPAVRRRAAEIITFERPNVEQRRAVISGMMAGVGLSPSQVDGLVAATGPVKQRDYGFTFSDLTQRLIPAIVLDAYPHARVDPVRAIAIAAAMEPTAPFQDKSR